MPNRFQIDPKIIAKLGMKFESYFGCAKALSAIALVRRPPPAPPHPPLKVHAEVEGQIDRHADRKCRQRVKEHVRTEWC